MQNALGHIRYALRQFRAAPVFAAVVILTLALGIGGTTAIFTLIHAVMIRSLPVSDPVSLYRLGDGNDCCVEGGPQDRWGLYSFPLYERLKAETPEFEEVAAFQAGRWDASVRREGTETVARPVGAEFVTGNYFSTLGVRAFGGRVFTPDDDKPSNIVRSGRIQDQPPSLADRLRRGSLGRGLDFHRRGPSLHRDRDCASGIFRRDTAERPSRHLGPSSTGTPD